MEMAWSLYTYGFVNALTRMVARRGWLRDMLNDNGTNFISGCKEINWHRNPPTAPHFGGVFERVIRSVKQAVNTVLGNVDVNGKELQTVFTGAESLINSRPLTQLGNDPNSELVLMPNHFLVEHRAENWLQKT